jgi:hypothetical protein
MRHLGADVFGHLPAALRLAQAGPTGLLQRPPLVVRRAETTSQAAAGIRDQEFLAALGADPRKAVFEIAALEELAHDRPDDGSPETVTLLVTRLVERLELRKEALDQTVAAGGRSQRASP